MSRAPVRLTAAQQRAVYGASAETRSHESRVALIATLVLLVAGAIMLWAFDDAHSSEAIRAKSIEMQTASSL